MYFCLCAAKLGLPEERCKESSPGTESGLAGRSSPLGFPFYIIATFPLYEEKASYVSYWFLGKEQHAPWVKHLMSCTDCSVGECFENQKQTAMFVTALLRTERSELEKKQVSVRLSEKQ